MKASVPAGRSACASPPFLSCFLSFDFFFSSRSAKYNKQGSSPFCSVGSPPCWRACGTQQWLCLNYESKYFCTNVHIFMTLLQYYLLCCTANMLLWAELEVKLIHSPSAVQNTGFYSELTQSTRWPPVTMTRSWLQYLSAPAHLRGCSKIQSRFNTNTNIIKLYVIFSESVAFLQDRF